MAGSPHISHGSLHANRPRARARGQRLESDRQLQGPLPECRAPHAGTAGPGTPWPPASGPSCASATLEQRRGIITACPRLVLS